MMASAIDTAMAAASAADKSAPDLDKAAEAVKFVQSKLDTAETTMKKLDYQLQYMENIVALEKSSLEQSEISTVDRLRAAFSVAIMSAFPDREYTGPADVQLCDSKFGDYQCNGAIAVSQWMKKQSGGGRVMPADVANTIIKHMPDIQLVDKLSVSPQGFINVNLASNYVQDRLRALLLHGFAAPQLKPEQIQRIVVDMSSPNIAKEMHVGHLRSTIIGDSISRLLTFCGHDVLKVNHVGDWGTQFGMLIAHLQEKFPDYKERSPPISDLQSFYKESKLRFDEDEEFKKRAHECVVKLQQHDPDFIKAWNQICEVSRHEFQQIYEKLDVNNLVERGESFYQDLMQDVVKDLGAQGLLENDEGRQIFFPHGCQIPLTIVKKDGGFTYDTSDMAALRHRIHEEHANRLIYVIDNGQRLHMDTIFAAARQCGWLDNARVRCDHVGFGLVLGEDKKKFKTRSGDTVRLVDLLAEGIERSTAKLNQLQASRADRSGQPREGGDAGATAGGFVAPQIDLSADEFAAARDAVAYGCIKYADLSHNRNNDYVFSFDLMLNDKGNTAVYMLYAYTRIRSIVRLAGVDLRQVLSSPDADNVLSNLSLQHEKELKLAKLLIRFHEVLQSVLDDLLIHKLCEYMYDVACVFSEFYQHCYCVERDPVTKQIKQVNMGRMLICEGTAEVLERCFDILGIRTVQKM